MTRTMSPGPCTGAVQIPASKSQAHRMLICAALSKAPSRLVLDGFSADIEATVQCLEALGAQLTQETAGLLITPIGARPANAKLDVGESGSTLRFLLPVLGALGVRAEVRMHGRLPERPLSPLWEVLEAHGMRLRQDGIVLYTDGQLCAGDYSLPGNVSSQFISGLLFALPLLNGNSTLTVTGALQSARYVAMTEQALAEAGILTKKDGPVWQIGGGQRYAAPAVQTVRFLQPQPRRVFNPRFALAERGEARNDRDQIGNRPGIQRNSVQRAAPHGDSLSGNGQLRAEAR